MGLGMGKCGVVQVLLLGSMLLVLGPHAGDGVSVEEDLSLSLSEKNALDKFRGKMLSVVPHAYMKQDIYLIRWLRARNLNLVAAEEMLRQNLRWRKDNRMDTIEEEDWSDMKDEYEYTNDTFDKEGRPIGTINMGSWNHRKAVLTGKGPRLLRYCDKLLEEASQKVISLQSRRGLNVTQFKVMINMEGFNIPQNACPRCLPLYVSFINSVEQHYPGHADQIILINTPPAFQLVLELIRPLFSAQTQAAMRIFSGDRKNQWGPYLDKEISREERRVEYGGTKND